MPDELERKVIRQAVLIEKLSGGQRKGKTVKFGSKRVSYYQKEKYVGWIDRKDYTALKKEGRINLVRSVKYEGRYNVKLGKTIFQKPILVRSGTMKITKRRDWRIIMYTTSQKRFVYQQFKLHRIPVKKTSSFQKVTNMRGIFRMMGIKASTVREVLGT